MISESIKYWILLFYLKARSDFLSLIIIDEIYIVIIDEIGRAFQKDFFFFFYKSSMFKHSEQILLAINVHSFIIWNIKGLKSYFFNSDILKHKYDFAFSYEYCLLTDC